MTDQTQGHLDFEIENLCDETHRASRAEFNVDGQVWKQDTVSITLSLLGLAVE